MAKKLYIEENQSIPSILILDDIETPPSGFLDQTNIENVGSNPFVFEQIEYNSIRKWIQELLAIKDTDTATAFGLCTNEEKLIVCKFILMPYSVRLSFHSEQNDVEYWEALVTKTEGNPIGLYEGRALIYQKMRIAVSHHLRKESWTPGDYFANLTMAQLFFRDVTIMKDLFIGSNDYEFRDFLNSSGMYDETTGFKSKTYWFAQLESELLEIYNSY